jgi:hypothetical protein
LHGDLFKFYGIAYRYRQPSEDGGVKQDTTALEWSLECPVPLFPKANGDVVVYETGAPQCSNFLFLFSKKIERIKVVCF